MSFNYYDLSIDNPTARESAFQEELRSLINRYSKEKESDTPDYILSQFMHNCLAAYGIAVKQRDNWLGKR